MPTITHLSLICFCATTIAAGSSSTAFADQAPPKDWTAKLVSVTLGEDCPRPADDKAVKAKSDASGDYYEKQKAKSRGRRVACVQTAVVVSIQSARAADVVVEKVEFLNADGKSVATLTASAPKIWNSKGKYVAWDQKLKAKVAHNVSWNLSSVNWSGLAIDPPVQGETRAASILLTLKIEGSSEKFTKSVTLPSPAVMVEPMVKT